MDDLIEALQIIAKYEKNRWPTSCLHDQLIVIVEDKSKMSSKDIDRLLELSFEECDYGFVSYRFGSC